jgi:putative methyltransferase (TIGR04325 family)
MFDKLLPFIPSALLVFYRKYWKKSGWFGDYTFWQAAEKDCDGYNSAAISARVVEATRQVRDGKAAFERDSVLFFEEELDKSLLNILGKIRAKPSENPLIVLDFGGALGSTYWQHRRVFEAWNLKWIVVEQAHFVEIGQKEFENDQLKFAFSIEDACEKETPYIVLFNSVLHYLETPYAFFEAVERHSIPSVFIGKTPTFEGKKDQITRQIVPKKIYEASYPSWVFSIDTLTNQLIKNKKYTIHWTLNEPYGIHRIQGKQLFFTDIYLESEISN